MRVTRGLGYAAPILFAILLVLYEDFTRLVNAEPLLAFVLVGVVAGFLTRSWWSLLATPLFFLLTVIALVLVLRPTTVADGSDITSIGGAVLLWAFAVLLPMAFGAGIGMGIAAAVRRRDDPWPRAG